MACTWLRYFLTIFPKIAVTQGRAEVSLNQLCQYKDGKKGRLCDPTSSLPLVAGFEFSQPRAHLVDHPSKNWYKCQNFNHIFAQPNKSSAHKDISNPPVVARAVSVKRSLGHTWPGWESISDIGKRTLAQPILEWYITRVERGCKVFYPWVWRENPKGRSLEGFSRHTRLW